MKYTLSIKIFLLVLICSFKFNTYAVPAYPYPIEFTQPDGTVITIQLKGDEKVNWAETLDGYTILVTKEGEYQYAIQDKNGDLGFSGVDVSNIEKRNTKETHFLKNILKGLSFSERQVEMLKSVWDVKHEKAQKSFPTTGNQNLLCLMMQTPDVQFVKTREEFIALFNQLNYTVGGATGSLKDYYLENSYGQLNLTVDVYGPYTAEHNMAHYASDARPLVREGVYLADDDVNYANYDSTNDGYVDGLYMIFAGYGQEAGGGPNTIWSHAWAVWPAVSLDGKWIYRYACSPELRGNSGTNITRIGVVGHEFGHILGAPDYYDTNGGTGGQFTGTGQWDMMASGTWNNGGATPAHHNVFTKVYFYNWADAVVLSEPASPVLLNAAEHSNSFYRINTNTNDEFFLLENRERHLFDAAIPGSGLIIYHVNSGVMSSASNNTVNTTHPQRMYPVAQNATSDPSGEGTYGTINHSSCAWTGLEGKKTEFSDISTPSSKSWAGQNTNKPITNILSNASAKTVSFDFMGGEGVFTVSGTLRYNNIATSPIENVEVLLINQNKDVVATINTNMSGYFEFLNLQNGDYTVEPNITLPWSGVTEMDITAYKKHIAQIPGEILNDDLAIAAGDVDASESLNVMDLVYIRQRIAGAITEFPAGDWIHTSGTVTVDEGNAEIDILAMIYGDANRSYAGGL